MFYSGLDINHAQAALNHHLEDKPKL